MSTSKGLIEKLCVAVSHFLHNFDTLSASYIILVSATKRLVCTDLCSSAVLLGLALLLTSKILIDTRQPIPEHVYLLVANFFGLCPNTKSSVTKNKPSIGVIGRRTINSLATAERDCTLQDQAPKERPGFR
jgi:hypothetical protein